MKTAIYPGSFDPITKGHLDIIKRASAIFGKVIVAVLKNSAKNALLSVEDRMSLISRSCADAGIQNVEVDFFDGLTVDFAKSKNANVLIRGLRAVSDFEFEMQVSQTNNALDENLNTVFLITNPEFNFISSSMVKEIAVMGADLSKFVPPAVELYLNNKTKR